MSGSGKSESSDLVAALKSACDPVGTPLADAPDGVPAAAVLLIVDTTSPDLPILFVVRSDRVSTHQGQIAFPGGRLEEGETPVVGALREAHEEVGLPLDKVQVIGTLPAFNTAVSNRWLTPVVALSDQPWQVVSDGFEVADWFWAPLQTVIDAQHYTKTFERSGVAREVHFYQVGEHIVWGVTGAIVAELLQRLSSGLSL
jgi:8-oxo-dGTP pyrophosphatase MutT (NUDIX family)